MASFFGKLVEVHKGGAGSQSHGHGMRAFVDGLKDMKHQIKEAVMQVKNLPTSIKDLRAGDTTTKFAIIGAGPAGIHFAYLLKSSGFKHVKVLESSNNIGGRAKATRIGDRLVNIAAWHFRASDAKDTVLARLIQELGLEGELREFVIRRDPVFVPTEDQPIIPDIEAQKHAYRKAHNAYTHLRRVMLGSSALLPRPDHVTGEAWKGTMSFMDLLRHKKLEALLPWFELSNQINGLGPLEHMRAFYGLVWHTHESLGFVDDEDSIRPVYRGLMIAAGYKRLMEAMVTAQEIDVLCNVTITGVNRPIGAHETGTIVYKPSREESGPLAEETFDVVVLSNNLGGVSPLLSDLSDEETMWVGEVQDRTLAVSAFEALVTPEGGDDGVYLRTSPEDGRVSFVLSHGTLLSSARTNNQAAPSGDGLARVYMAYQSLARGPLPSDITTLRTALDEDLASMGFQVDKVVDQYPWKQFTHLSTQGLEEKMHQQIFESQGKRHTIFIGAAPASFDSVAHVVAYNALVSAALGFDAPEVL